MYKNIFSCKRFFWGIVGILVLFSAVNLGSLQVLAAPCGMGEWYAEYFNNTTLTGTPILARCEASAPNYPWGEGSPAPQVSVNMFSVRWTGTPMFAKGTVTFKTVSDDGVRLFLDGRRIINNWTYHPTTTNTAKKTVAAGVHKVVMEYFEGDQAATAKLSWSGAGNPGPSPVPTPTATPAPTITPVPTQTPTPSPTLSPTPSPTQTPSLSGLPQVTGVITSATSPTSISLSWNSASGTSNLWVTGYYAGYFWDWTGSGADVAVNAVDMSTTTHFVFARYSPGGGALGGSFGQLIPGAGTGHQFVEDKFITKAHANNNKAIMMVGGAGDGAGFDGSTASATVQSTFINNIVSKMVEKNYDGVDIDWEENLSTPQQQAQAISFLTELRAKANQNSRYQAPNKPVIITWPAFWGNINYPSVTPWHVQIASLVDQYNLMTYSMAGSWPGWLSWHHSPLAGAQPNHPTSIEASVSEYVAAGVPRSKIGIGIGLYGIYYRPPVTGPRQSLDQMSGWAQIDDNENNYQRLMQDGAFTQPGGVYHWDDVAKQSYYSYAPTWNRWGNTPITYLSFEDEKSIAAKGQWSKNNSVGGTIVWMINYGYLPSTGKNPMMQAVKQAFLGSGSVNIAGYHIYRDGVRIASVSSTSFQDLGLTPGNTYIYTVAAYDAAGAIGLQSAPVIVTVPL